MEPKKPEIVETADNGLAITSGYDKTAPTTTISPLFKSTTDATTFTLNSIDSEKNLSAYSSHHNSPPENAKDLVTEVLKVEDDPTINPWTFRVFFLGLGLSTFGGSLATIYYFKPQTVAVSTIFLAVISYVLGEALAAIIPRWGFIGRILNPHPVC